MMPQIERERANRHLQYLKRGDISQWHRNWTRETVVVKPAILAQTFQGTKKSYHWLKWKGLNSHFLNTFQNPDLDTTNIEESLYLIYLFNWKFNN